MSTNNNIVLEVVDGVSVNVTGINAMAQLAIDSDGKLSTMAKEYLTAEVMANSKARNFAKETIARYMVAAGKSTGYARTVWYRFCEYAGFKPDGTVRPDADTPKVKGKLSDAEVAADATIGKGVDAEAELLKAWRAGDIKTLRLLVDAKARSLKTAKVATDDAEVAQTEATVAE